MPLLAWVSCSKFSPVSTRTFPDSDHSPADARPPDGAAQSGVHFEDEAAVGTLLGIAHRHARNRFGPGRRIVVKQNVLVLGAVFEAGIAVLTDLDLPFQLMMLQSVRVHL